MKFPNRMCVCVWGGGVEMPSDTRYAIQFISIAQLDLRAIQQQKMAERWPPTECC